MSKTYNPYDEMLEVLDRAAGMLGLCESDYVILKYPERDIPAPDVNTNAEVMGWIMDTYSMFQGHTVPGVVTGKPIEIGGSLGRREATGRGVMFVTREILHRMGMPVLGTRIAIQGMGNVGSVAARLLQREGCHIVAVSDVSGGLYHPDGLDIESILAHQDGGKPLSAYEAPGVAHIDNAALLACECDVLIPAALQNQITEENASSVRAAIIVEGANGPTTVGADRILEEAGKVIVPDILANAGGVVVSYFEWVQNIQSLMWDEDEINQALEKIMTRAFNEVWDAKAARSTSLRMGAYMVALQRVVNAKKIRGIFP